MATESGTAGNITIPRDQDILGAYWLARTRFASLEGKDTCRGVLLASDRAGSNDSLHVRALNQELIESHSPLFLLIDQMARSTAPCRNLTKLGSGNDNVFTSDGEMITPEGSVKVALHGLSRSLGIATFNRVDY
jgi:hypothetical protein